MQTVQMTKKNTLVFPFVSSFAVNKIHRMMKGLDSLILNTFGAKLSRRIVISNVDSEQNWMYSSAFRIEAGTISRYQSLCDFGIDGLEQYWLSITLLDVLDSVA